MLSQHSQPKSKAGQLLGCALRWNRIYSDAHDYGETVRSFDKVAREEGGRFTPEEVMDDRLIDIAGQVFALNRQAMTIRRLLWVVALLMLWSVL